MKVFLFGAHWINAGPDNVNRKLIEASDDRLIYLKNNGKLMRLLETIINVLRCDVIVLSGMCSPFYYRILRSSGRKIVYLMHGDISFENEVNHQNTSLVMIKLQNEIFKNVSAIACVSEGYSKWVGERYAQFQSKITFVNNGLDLKKRLKVTKEPFSIAIAGGNRPIKANKYVCEAAKILQAKGIDCKVYVFGRHYPSCEELPEVDGLEYMGHLDGKEYYDKLDSISIFVMNSDVESFGLTMADAINCNCSILMSRNIGAASIIKARESDFIKDNHDPEEIARKIIKLQETPNIDRLYKTIDLDSISARTSYKKLINICERVNNECM